MKKVTALAAVLALTALSSCATSHAARYAYGKSSFYAEAESGDVSRALFGVPLFIVSVGWDIITVPAQAAFGVWPLWGPESLSMIPEGVGEPAEEEYGEPEEE